MILRFDAQGVRKLVEHAENAKEHTKSCYDDSDPVPALVLVGNQGVYLVSSGIPQLLEDGENEDEPFAVYAQGINPNVDAFDDWWRRKRQSFGGDDGFEWLPLDMIKPYIGKEYLYLRVTKTRITTVEKIEKS